VAVVDAGVRLTDMDSLIDLFPALSQARKAVAEIEDADVLFLGQRFADRQGFSTGRSTVAGLAVRGRSKFLA
jgi:hypothetical protein